MSKHVYSITPIEFEKYCKEILIAFAEKEKLVDFSITHDAKIVAQDGTYQIDIYATFVALGVQFKVLCECKQYSSTVNREKVVILADKVRSIGAHKGILLSTSGFQSGAIQYAKEHGIALIQVFDKKCVAHAFSSGDKDVESNAPFMDMYNSFPRYRAIDKTSSSDKDNVIYPTTELVRKLYRELELSLFGEVRTKEFNEE